MWAARGARRFGRWLRLPAFKRGGVVAKYLDGEKLRLARGARSMASVGKVLGVTRQQIHWYEKGKCLPPVDKLLLMLELYKVKFEKLLSDKADLTNGAN